MRMLPSVIPLLLLQLAASIEALKITSISKSQTVIRYSELSMHCFFQLENDERLYSLKWLLNDAEILRFLPGAKQLKIIQRSPELLIDERRSNGTFIYFHQVDFSAEGTWKCRVMLEGPSFEAAESTTHIRVVVFPNDEPAIIKSHPSYQESDTLTFTCVSCCSNPPANLTWILNGNSVPKDILQGHPLIALPDQTFNTSLALRVKANEAYFRDGVMRVRCIANVADGDYWKSSEISVKWPGSRRNIGHSRLNSNNVASIHEETRFALTSLVIFVLLLMNRTNLLQA